MSQPCPTCRYHAGVEYEETGAHSCRTCRGTGRVYPAALPLEGIPDALLARVVFSRRPRPAPRQTNEGQGQQDN